MTPKSHGDAPDSADTFYAAIAGTIIIGIAAFGLSLLLGAPLAPQLRFSIDDALIGIIATLPPVVFLWWFSNTNLRALVEFRNSQIEFFSQIGFRFTPIRIVAMAVAAGVCEELLFRGVLQTWFASFSPALFAILVTNVIFGLLHMRTALYAVIAGGVGAYFGVLYALNGNLVAPMIAHGLYDAIALEYTRRAIEAYRK